MKFFSSLIFLIAFSLQAMGANEASTPEMVEKGKKVYKMNCATCHGDTGKGDGMAAAALKPPPRDLTKGPFKAGNKPEQLFSTITKGLPGTAMVGYGHLPETDRWAIVHFIGSLKK